MLLQNFRCSSVIAVAAVTAVADIVNIFLPKMVWLLLLLLLLHCMCTWSGYYLYSTVRVYMKSYHVMVTFRLIKCNILPLHRVLHSSHCFALLCFLSSSSFSLPLAEHTHAHSLHGHSHTQTQTHTHTHSYAHCFELH